MEEVSLTIDEAKLRKMTNEMLRQRCTSGDEHHCQKDPEAPSLSLINQDLLYLKKGNYRPEKIVLSLHKFLVIIFNNDDIEERTSRWVNKCVKKFNPYARYGVETLEESSCEDLLHKETERAWKIIGRDLFKLKNRLNTGLLWSLSVFIRSTVIWKRVHDFQLGIKSYQQKVNLTAPTKTFSGIKDHEMFSIIYEPVHGIIYKNSKKEKRVIRHS
ncbi:hypothetical protein Tco_0351993 [Tanacetum coccineum]